MKWHKSKLGFEVAFVKQVKYNVAETLKKIPEGCEPLSEGELAYLRFDEEKYVLKNIELGCYVLTNKRACWLGIFDDDSCFGADDRYVINLDSLRGVFIKKIEVKNDEDY